MLTQMTAIELDVGAVCQRGTTHPENEDRALVCDAVLCGGTLALPATFPFVAAVFDGVSQGGHGATASSLAAEAFERVPRWNPTDAAERMQGWAHVASARAEEEVDMFRRQAGAEVVATTVAGFCAAPSGEAIVFNVGDSRVYRMRGALLTLLSREHSPEALAHGFGDALEGAASHVLERAIGFAEGGRRVDTTSVQLRPGDIFAACTDGACDALAETRIQEILGRNADARACARALVDAARAFGSVDDATAVVVKVKGIQVG